MTIDPTPPAPRTFTILLCDDQFSDIWQDAIPVWFANADGFRFLRFKSERRLRELLDAGPADLVMLYVGNIHWEPTPSRPPPQGEKPNYFADKLDVLGELSARHRVPVIAMQGMDLRERAFRAGVAFLEIPFKPAELIPVIASALGLPLPPPA